MKNENNKKLNLYQPAIYQIKVPGHIEVGWTDWVDDMVITFETGDDSMPVSTLLCSVDQAGLIGLLRRLYSLGLPLISVICMDFK